MAELDYHRRLPVSTKKTAKTTAILEHGKQIDAGKSTAWSLALQDAYLELDKCKVRMMRLKASIRIFKRQIDSGEPWPGTK
jgi:hypothetical protein